MLLNMGLVSCPKMSVYNYEQALCNISEEPRPLQPLDHAMIQGRNQILGKNQYIYQYIRILCYIFYDMFQLKHVPAPRCHPQGVIITKVYKPTCPSLGSDPPHSND